ncbi:MAG: sigma-70 family RNA polymerase sigma factor [Proteobacteria bacterium]|nr:sigma-70 family RNA polymerase sigma factor [Pseudomonadota bacterium]
MLGTRDLRARIEATLRQDWQRLFSYAHRLTRNRDEAADLLQSCAVKALAAPRGPDSEASLRAWLYTILRNAWVDQLRQRLPPGDDATLGPTGAELWSFDDRLIADLTVRRALERIDGQHREVIELVDLAGFRYAEAAQILAVPTGTVMSRLSRARLALLEAIEGQNIRPIHSGRRHVA